MYAPHPQIRILLIDHADGLATIYNIYIYKSRQLSDAHVPRDTDYHGSLDRRTLINVQYSILNNY